MRLAWPAGGGEAQKNIMPGGGEEEGGSCCVADDDDGFVGGRLAGKKGNQHQDFPPGPPR